jgi:hypothetical protein
MDTARLLVKAYVLGGRLLAPAFRRAVHNFTVIRLNLLILDTEPCIILPIQIADSNTPSDRVILQ